MTRSLFKYILLSILFTFTLAQDCSNFGGIYQVNSLSVALNIPNAETSDITCPPGFVAQRIGRVIDPSNNALADQFVCTQQDQQACLTTRFGGSYHESSCELAIENNPVTNGLSCPTNYNAVLAGRSLSRGCATTQYICRSTTANRFWKWGGAYQKLESTCTTSNDNINNPLTNGLTCPPFYSEMKMAKVSVPNDNCNATQYMCVMEEENECATNANSCVTGSTCTEVSGSGYTCSNCGQQSCYTPFTSSLPLVILSTEGASFNTGSDIIGSIVIIGANGTNTLSSQSPKTFEGKTQIKISSLDARKPDFKINLRDPTDLTQNLNTQLFGFPSENDFTLIGVLNDRTFVRDPLTWKLFRDLGYWAPRTVFVELFVVENSNTIPWDQLPSVNYYKGIYIFAETVKRDNNRIDIAKLDATNTSPDEITGGYITKVETADSTDIIVHRFNYSDITLDTPKTPTIAQFNYIQQYFQNLDQVMNSANFADLTTGYHSLIYPISFVDTFLLAELSNNLDAYSSKLHLWKDRIPYGKLHAGPIDSSSAAWGRNTTQGSNSWIYSTTISTGTPYYWSRLLEDSNYSCRLVRRWQRLRTTVFNTTSINQYLAATYNQLAPIQSRENLRNPFYGTNDMTFQQYYEQLATFIEQRASWIDSNINQLAPAQCVFPNPPSVRVTEIKRTSPEFLELKNTGNSNIDMSGLQMGGGITFSFPNLVLNPRSFVVLVKNVTEFTARYPGVAHHGVYGGKLGDSDEISLLDVYGSPLWTINYQSQAPWPDTIANPDRSIVPTEVNPTGDQNNPSLWRLSSTANGTPNADDRAATVTGVSVTGITGTEHDQYASSSAGTAAVAFTLLLVLLML